MVTGLPKVTVALYNEANVGDVDPIQLWATCIETNKGPINEPVIVRNANEAMEIFGYDATPFLNVGGQGLALLRVGSGNLTKAEYTVKDTADKELFTLRSKFYGTSPIVMNISTYIDDTFVCNLSSPGYIAELYDGTNIKNMLKVINARSKFVDVIDIDDAEEPDTGETIETITNMVMPGGSNGDGDPITGELTEEKASMAHKKGLNILEDLRVAGVFCQSKYASIHTEYAKHAQAMNQPEVCRWRYALLGAVNRDSLDDLIERATWYNDERILFVGQGLYRGSEAFLPYQATAVVAGLRSKLFYGDSLYGGEPKKILTTFTDRMHLTTNPTDLFIENDYVKLNERGVITFKKHYDDITVYEGVTTVQPGEYNRISQESIVNIVNYIAHGIYDRLYQFLGRNMTDELTAAIEKNLEKWLEDRKNIDQTLIALPVDENDDSGKSLSAYEVTVNITPKNKYKAGTITANLKVTPVNSTRTIDASIFVM